MKEFKGTKGKWKYEICNGSIRFEKPNMDLWFKDEDNGFKESPSEVLANAKLIAAAPELLEAAKKGLECLNEIGEFQEGWNDELEFVKKAIEKALK